MKRIMTFAFALTIAAALALTTTSCSNEDILTDNNEQPQVTTNGVQVTVGAGFDEATTRSTVVIDGTKRVLKFTTDDRLYINGEIGGGKYIAGYLNMNGSPTNDNKSAQFTGTYGTDLKAYSWNSTSSQYEETSHTFSTTDILGECSNVKAVLVDASSTFTVNPTYQAYHMSGTFAGSASTVEDLITKGIEVKGDYVSASHSFTLSNNNTIFNCIFSGLAPSTTYKAAQALSDAYFQQYNFTTDANGVGTIAFIAAVNDIVNTYFISVFDNNDTEVGSIPLGWRSFDAKIYNINRRWTGNRFVKLIGKFTVNDGGKQVYIAPGNLQATYDGSSWSWGFAAHQWDIIGNAAGNTSINGDGTISGTGTVDLFGWVGASKTTWTGAAQYGISNSKNQGAYGNVANEALKSDWGNTIGSGWRTLTEDEWTYLFYTRAASTVNSTANARYAMATVVSRSGVILFPDTYTHPGGVTAPASINAADANYSANNYDATAWAKMEAAGCVFLPAAGNRDGSSVSNAGSNGYYWSSSSPNDDSSQASCVYFRSNFLIFPSYGYRYYGRSVRLVRDAN